MLTRRSALLALASTAIVGTGTSSFAAYPDRPIRFILSHPPGGSADVIARLMLPKLQASLGQPIVIENRSGAGGVIAMDLVAKASPDGYTIGFGAAGALALSVARGDPINYDPLKDLTPIVGVSGQPFILAAARSFQGKTVQDVIGLAKAGGTKFSLAHGGAVMELVAAMFDQAAGLRLDLVPYRGTAPVVNDLLGGHVTFGIIDIPSGKPSIDAGLIKAIAISSPKRFAGLPNVPTFTESGLPGVEAMGWLGVVGPSGLAPDLVTKLNQAFLVALGDPEITERLQSYGSIKLATDPAGFRALIENDVRKYKNIAEKYDLKAK